MHRQWYDNSAMGDLLGEEGEAISYQSLGSAVENVTATLTGYQADVVTVIQGEIVFGDIPAGETAEGTFVIRIPINMNAVYDESQLEFTFNNQ